MKRDGRPSHGSLAAGPRTLQPRREPGTVPLGGGQGPANQMKSGCTDILPRRELLREFTSRQRLPETSDWALGWDTPTEGVSSSGRYFSRDSVGHLGFTGTSLWIDLEREVVVVLLTNRVHLVAKRSRFELRPKVHDLIIEAFREG